MNELKNKVEILAPAGDIESFYAAINAGADAVYLGLSDFNARIKAENFTKNSIADAVKYAHLLGVKVYVTVNILINDSEVDEFISVIEACVNAKTDAFIIQDLCMAALIKTLFPEAVLHASTQAGISNLDGAKLFEKLGFSRVVLARETKLADIRDIKNNTSLEIEYFVQGALCVSYSGNCYMSSLKCGMSGNRGKCKQLCRLNYTASDKNKELLSGHLLSTNDLCLVKNLKTLYAAGVTSFKIEGRLKRPSYVAKAVSVYRKAANETLSDKQCDKEIKELSKIFSRGKYNETAYLYDNDKIIDVTNQTHFGEKIGKVIKKEKFKNLYKIFLSAKTQINVGDGLKFVGATSKNGRAVSSIGVGNVIKDGDCYAVFTSNENIRVGDEAYKATDAQFESSVLAKTKRVPLSVTADFYSGKLPSLTLEANGVKTSVQGENILEKSINSPLTKETLTEKIKLNDTVFCLSNLTLNTDDVFFPVSQLNALRRTAIKSLEDKILASAPSAHRVEAEFPYSGVPVKAGAKFVLVNDIDSFTESAYNTDDYTVVFQPTCYDEPTLNAFIDGIKKQKRTEYYLYLPVVATKEEIKKIDELLEYSDKYTKTGIVANNYYAVKYFKSRPCIAGIGLNAYNSYTVKTLYGLGADYVVKSIEQPQNLRGTLSYKGNPPLMTLTHCPYKAVANSSCSACTYTSNLTYRDEKNNLYKIRRYKINYCYFELLSVNDTITLIDGEDFIDLRT